ncbi:MAG: hypothetical protein IJA55_01205 [Clostridia bacterium]|nr:hypothetical protein [Clostridia bacterium]
MALIKCTECGKSFSDKAACCPECGCPTKLVLKEINSVEVIAKKDENLFNGRTSSKNKNLIKITIVAGILLICILVVFIIIRNVVIPSAKYNDAVELMKSEKYAEAIKAFQNMDGYKNSNEFIKECEYGIAVGLMESGDYLGSIRAFEVLDGYKNSNEFIKECEYSIAVGLMESGDYLGSIRAFEALDGYKDTSALIMNTRRKYAPKATISAGTFHAVGIKPDGSVVSAGANFNGQCDVSEWNDVISVSAGDDFTIGLRSDFTVVAAGSNKYGACDIESWSDIVSVSAYEHTVGLKANGTVVAVGWDKFGQCSKTVDWENIVAVAAGDGHTVGLCSDGTVVAVGSNESGQCNVEDWTDIIAVSAGIQITVGLKADGTVIATGKFDTRYQYNVNGYGYKNIKAIAANGYVAVLADSGRVSVSLKNGGVPSINDDIVAVAVGNSFAIALDSNGYVWSSYGFQYESGIDDWGKIKLP